MYNFYFFFYDVVSNNLFTEITH